MKIFIIGLTLLSSLSASANTIYCTNSYTQDAVVFTATITSPTSIKDFVYKEKVGNVYFTSKILEQVAYRPSATYANFISVMGELKMTDKWNNDLVISKILLEKDFYQKNKFKAVIAVQGSDGGSYLRFSCYNNP